MVAISFRSTLFAYYCVLVAIKDFSLSADAVAIPGYRRSLELVATNAPLSTKGLDLPHVSKEEKHKVTNKSAKGKTHHPEDDDDKAENNDTTGDDGNESAPLNPPKKVSPPKVEQKHNQNHKSKPQHQQGSGAKQMEKRMFIKTMNPILDFSLGVFGRRLKRSPIASRTQIREYQHIFDLPRHANIIIDGDDAGVHLDRRHKSYGKVIVKGDHDRVRISDNGHHYHGEHNKIVVKGDNDKIRISQRHHHHDEDEGHQHYDKIIVKGDHDRVRVHDGGYRHTKVVIKGDDDRVRVQHRDVTDLEERSPRHRHHRHGHHDHEKDGGTLIVKGDHQTVNARAVDKREQAGVPGRVDIMSSASESQEGKRLGSLCLTDKFTLNACENNQTDIYLVAVNALNSQATSNSTASDSLQQVMLQIPVYDPEALAMTSYCATFNPSPQGSEPLSVEPCYTSTASPEEPHKSQRFDYDEDSGIVRPMQHAQSMGDEAETSSTFQTRQDQAQNLTLVFVSDAPIAAKAEPAFVPTSSVVAPSQTPISETPASSFTASDDVMSTDSTPATTDSTAPTPSAAPLLAIKGEEAASTTASSTFHGALNVNVSAPSSSLVTSV